MQRFRLLVVNVIFISALGAQASQNGKSDTQKSTRAVMTLTEINERVLARSEYLKAQKLQVQSVEAQGRQATAWHNPIVSAEIGRIRDPLNNSMTYDLRLTQPFYFPGKLSAYGAIFEREAAFQKIQGNELAESLSLEAVYFAYAFSIAEQRASHSQDRIRRISLMRTYMRAQAYASPAKLIQRNIVSTQLIALQKTLAEESAAVESAWQKLNVYLDQKEKISVVTPWLIDLKDLNLEKFLEQVEKGNRRLKAKQMQIARLEAEESYEKRVPLPDVALSAFYRRETLEHPGINEFFGGMFSLPIPILNANRSAVEAAQKKVAAAKEEEKYLTREVLHTARSLHAEYMHKKVLFDNFKEEKIPALERQMRYADRELKLGRIDLLSYLELELKTHEAYVAYYDAQLELVKVITQMILLIGESSVYKGDLYVFQDN
ncbi:MAG TPA: TolC family protein [Turneriella sp.]|nr:TolC family protein [Turneriella sp.]